MGDPLLCDRRLAEVRRETVGEPPPFGTYEVLQGDRAAFEEIATAIGTLSLGGRRLVVLQHCERLREEVQRAAADLVGEIGGGTRLVAIAAAADMRKAFFAAFRRHGRVETLGIGTARDPRARRRELTDFAEALARDRGVRLIPAARDALVDHVGGDAGRLAQEVEKLALRFSEAEVGPEEVVDSIGGARARSAFALEGALRERRIDRAIAFLREAVAAGERPEVLVGQIAGELRALLRARALLDSGHSEESAKRAFGTGRGYFVVPAARRFRRGELARALEGLADIDRAIKRGAGAAAARIEGLLLELSGREEPRAGGPRAAHSAG